jgi:hypothetical protein
MEVTTALAHGSPGRHHEQETACGWANGVQMVPVISPGESSYMSRGKFETVWEKPKRLGKYRRVL